MTEAVVVSLITGGLSLLGVVFSGVLTSRKNENAMKTAQAVTDTKLTELTREVRAQNHCVQRVPVVEEQIRVINHRIRDLEAFQKAVGGNGYGLS